MPPLFRADWSLKPSGQAFFDLVFDTWWTDIQSVTDENGYVEIRGFMGEYEAVVDVAGSEESQTLYLEPGEGVQETSITLAQQVSIGEEKAVPDDLNIQGHYPEPAGRAVTIDLIQPEQGSIQIDLFNLLGQKVGTMYDAQLPRGRHSVYVDTGAFANGTYLYRVQSDKGLVQRLLTIRN